MIHAYGGHWIPASLMTLLLAVSPGIAHDESQPALLGAIYPQISPDGESIALAYQGSIWRIPSAGGVMRQLTSTRGYDNWPTWSPNGERIAFVNGRGSHVGPVQMIEADDGTVVELAKTPIVKNKLAFSPHGSRLLGMFNQAGEGFSLRWFDTKTGELGEQLYPDKWGLAYSLSRDGNWIAISTTLDTLPDDQGGNNGPQCDLWTMPAEGGKPTKLTRFPGRVYDITYSADGDSLFVVSSVGGVHNDLWHVPIDDPVRGVRKMTFGQADEDTPSTDSTGRRLVFSDNHLGPTQLVMRDLQTSLDSVITVNRRDYGRPTGRLSLQVKDADTGESTTARISIQHEDGKYQAPPDAIYRMLGEDIHFYCQGMASFDLPVGRYELKAARGPEYRVLRREIVIQPNANIDTELMLQRWTNQREKNWYSGESHIHANYGYGQWYNSPRTMLAQSAGEDLIVSNFMVANSDSDGVFDREFFRGMPDPLSSDDNILYWNQEFRSTIWGHLTLLNLKQLVEPIFTGFADTTHPHDHPTNADIADHTHDQQGHVNYTHPAHNMKDPYLSAYSAKALPLDVALGKVDSIDVMGSNHEANMAIWYRLLNCGFHVPASAGTDCFLNRVRSRLPGQVRVYVYVDDDFTYQRWIDSLRAGRTFVTDGPMFDFTVSGQMPGSTIKLTGDTKVSVRARIRSQYEINRAEVVLNGNVIYQATIDATGHESGQDVVIETDVPVTQSGWIAVRAAGKPHRDQPTGKLLGHTSAVYLDVQGKPIDASADAAYFVTWIDRLHADIRTRNRIPSRHVTHVQSQIGKAREIFQQLAMLNQLP